jgi:hypothetical protein
LSQLDWETILGRLLPVVERTDGTFGPRQNDLRVFLMSILHADPRGLERAAGSMADYYRGAAPSEAKCLDMIRLLGTSGRSAELPGVFTPRYVVDARALGRPLGELFDQAREVFAVVSPATLAATLHSFTLGLATLRQAAMCVDSYSLPEAAVPLPRCLAAEGRIPPQREWTLEMVEEVLAQARALLDGGERPRASALLERWLGGCTPRQLALRIIRGRTMRDTSGGSREDRVYSVLRTWGTLAFRCGIARDFPVPRTEQSRAFLAHHNGGWLVAAADAADDDWLRALAEFSYGFIHDVEDAAARLAAQERWDVLGTTLTRLELKRTKFSPLFQARAATWVVLHCATDALVISWVAPVADKAFTPLTGNETGVPHWLAAYANVALASGYLDPGAHSTTITDRVFWKLPQWRREGRARQRTRQVLFAAAWLGRLLRQCATGDSSGGLLASGAEVAGVVGSLLSAPAGRSNTLPDGYWVVAADLLAIILRTAKGRCKDWEPLEKVLLNAAATKQATLSLEPVWVALAARGHLQPLREWFNHWVGPDGLAWHEELGERIDLARRFATLARPLDWEEECRAAETRAARSRIGYLGHKDYSLDEPLTWFALAASSAPHIWEAFGWRLLTISDEASRTGDNRLAVQVDRAVAAAAARCGPAAFYRLAESAHVARRRPTALSDDMLLEGLVDALRQAELTEEDLVAIWCLGLGATIWQEGRDPLRPLREAVRSAAGRRGFDALPDRLTALSSFEWTAGAADDIDKNDGEQEGRADPFADLIALAPEDAIQALATRARRYLRSDAGALWRAVVACAKRLAATGTRDEDSPRQLLAVVLLRPDRYSWTYDGVGHAIEALFPLLSNNERETLMRWAIESVPSDQSPELWLPAAIDHFQTLLQLEAEAGRLDASVCLDRELAAHEAWLHMATDQGVSVIPQGLPPFDANAVESWPQVALALLTGHMEQRGAAVCSAALKGTYALLTSSAQLSERAPNTWARASEWVRSVLLQILEPLAAEHPDRFAAWAPLVEDTLVQGHGADQLQAWVTLEAYRRVVAPTVAAHILPALPPHAHSRLLRPPTGLLDAPPDSAGLVHLTRGSAGARERVRMLSAVLSLSERAIEEAAAEHLRSLPVPETKHTGQTAPKGDMLIVHNFEHEAVVDWAVAEARRGCFGDVLPAGLGQALLPTDEPRLLVHTGKLAIDADSWPIDEQLEKLLAGGTSTIVASLEPHVVAGLPWGARVLAARLLTYSRHYDVELTVATYWQPAVEYLGRVRQPKTLNGRAFCFYEAHLFEPHDPEGLQWFTHEAGGIGSFIHADMTLQPTSVWRTLGWNPSATDPFTWLLAGEPVAWLDVLHGPVRDLIQDALHRQPLLLRWVVTPHGWEQATALAGTHLRCVSEVAVEPWRDE